MVSQLEEKIRELAEGTIDFEGQKLAETLMHAWLVIAAIISFISGFVLESVFVTFATFGGASLVLALIMLPPWPFFNRTPVKWLKAKEDKKSI
ncbi:hypothetical protein FRB99_005597 [Tulasnella sp. 403]|nr:hypothetical protein FRB99_005597 [Tulasnella sp. 403]